METFWILIIAGAGTYALVFITAIINMLCSKDGEIRGFIKKSAVLIAILFFATISFWVGVIWLIVRVVSSVIS